MKTKLWPIAEIARVHGLKGTLKARLYGDEPFHFEVNSTVIIGDHPDRTQELRLIALSGKGSEVLLTFEQIDSAEKAQPFLGQYIWLKETAFKPLPAGSAYLKDLVGCQLIVAHDPRSVGQVTGFTELPHSVLLEVTLNDGQVLDIPYCSLYFGALNQALRTLEVLHLDEFIEGMGS